MNSTIDRSEYLYRSVPNKPGFWKNEFGRPTSALFKTSPNNGISVDRGGERKDDVIVDSFISRFGEIKATVKLNAGLCLDIDAHLVYCPVEDNCYHAEIHNSPDKANLSKGKIRRLTDECKIIYEKQNIETM